MIPAAFEVETAPLPLTAAGADDLIAALSGVKGVCSAHHSGDPGDITVHLVFRPSGTPPPEELRDVVRSQWEVRARTEAAALMSKGFERLGLLVTLHQVSHPRIAWTDFDLAFERLDKFERAMDGHDAGSHGAAEALHTLRTWAQTAEEAEDPYSAALRRQAAAGDEEEAP